MEDFYPDRAQGGTMFDYDLKFKDAQGKVVKSISYQDLITLLMVRDEIVQGRPLSEGGAPQVALISEMVRNKLGATSVEVYFNGNQIL
jgi:hypothetical protein